MIPNYSWSTETAHFDNHESLSDYIDNHMPEWWEVEVTGKNKAEIADDFGDCYQVTASGEGDSFNHIVTFTRI